MFRVGTSGWNYQDWPGRFYPDDLPPAEWLAYYAARFATVEVNSSFYRLPEPKTFVSWRAAVPGEFSFAVKASRFITHVKRLKDPRAPVSVLLGRARGLGRKLGPVLFQLPPRFGPDLGRLAETLDAIPASVRAAFEFRDRSWENDEVFSMLDAAGAAFVLADRPGARVPHVTTGGWTYVRFHAGRLASPGYTRRKLARWADRLAPLRGDAYVYFNNDTGAAAVRDAATFSALLRERKVALAAPGIAQVRPRLHGAS